MTKEDKELLLKDLCSRLPYGVMVCETFFQEVNRTISAIDCGVYYILDRPDKIKPYLRPMYSMTEEEEKEYSEIFWSTKADYIGATCVIDWLNEHHFDYRGLIEKGLAIEAPEDMYK